MGEKTPAHLGYAETLLALCTVGGAGGALFLGLTAVLGGPRPAAIVGLLRGRRG